MSHDPVTSIPPVASIPVDDGFAAVLRDHTKTVHRLAERSGFIADLLRGRATGAGYALFLRNLHPAYAALEAGAAFESDDRIVGAFADPRLHRRLALEADLTALAGEHWAALPLLPQAADYAAAIAVATGDPGRFVGHAYARYLGDLSGGQILRPLLSRSLALGPETLAFYVFPAFPDVAVPKAAMRAALDRVPVGSSLAAAITEAAIAAFEHNVAVSEAVAETMSEPAAAASLAEP